MAAITMEPRSQPASMPAESNLGQMTHLISPARSELSEIDPSWEIRALADADGSIGTSSADDVGAVLCANPRTPVCGSPPELAAVPTVEQCAGAGRSRTPLVLSVFFGVLRRMGMALIHSLTHPGLLAAAPVTLVGGSYSATRKQRGQRREKESKRYQERKTARL